MMTGKRLTAFPTWAWMFLIFLAAAMACNLPSIFQPTFLKPTPTATSIPTPTATPQPLPPTVIETRPSEGSQLSLLGTVILYFNQEMDKPSVEGALRAEPDIPGQLQWVDSQTVEFIPDQALAPGQEMNLILGTGARAANGLSFPSPVELEYSSPQYLRPTQFLPPGGGAEIDPAAAIMVTFNQPVIAMASQGDGSLPAFTLEPSVPGKGEWVNTSTYIYTPEPALAGGVDYTVQLNPDLTSTYNAPLAEDAETSWSFSTLDPALVDAAPEHMAEDVPLDTAIELTFNQAMDKNSFQAHLTLRDSQGSIVPGAMEWSQDLTTVTFKPRSPLARDRTYTVHLPEETASAGGTPLGTDHSWQFRTVGDLRLLSSSPRQGFSTTVYQGIILYFNSTLDREDLEEKISIQPEVSNLRTSWVESDYALRITGDFAALEEYNLKIEESLSDAWGSTLSEPIRLNFSTRSLTPNLVITQGTHDLFLTGEENAIPAQGTNLSSLVISLGTLPPERYAASLGSDRYQALQNYTPEDNRSWPYAVNIPGDASYPFSLPLTPDGSPLSPGLYRLEVSSTQLPYNPAPYLLAVSHIHLTLKVSPHDILAWAVDLGSGEPVPEARIQIFDQNGQAVFSGETDGRGMFTAVFDEPQNLYDESFYAVLGEPGKDSFAVSSSTWQQGSEPYLFGLSADYAPELSRTYIYTERPIYRPGQTVHYRLVKRIREGNRYELPREDQIEGVISGPSGELASFTHPLSGYGTAHGQYTLSEFAEPGYYRLESGGGMVVFQVAAYRKPEIDLRVGLSPSAALGNETLQAAVDARYYFDAPAGGVDLDWSLTARHAPFSLPGYQVGPLDNRWWGVPPHIFGGSFGVGIDSGEGRTSRSGKWAKEVNLESASTSETDISLPATYMFEVTVKDESGFPVSARAETLVHPSRFYIGVRPEAWISKAGEEAGFEVQVVDWEKNPDGVRELQAALKKVRWEKVGEDPYDIRYERRFETVDTMGFQTDAAGKAALEFTPPMPGTYQVDVYGEHARTEILVWVAGPGQATWPTLSNQKLNLVADQDTYHPGERARIFIPNPFPEGGQGLITLEREQIHYSTVVNIQGSGRTVTLPLSSEEAPNVYLSVTLLGKDEEGELSFRQGYLNLPVDPGEKVLDVELVGDPQRTAPRGDVQFTIQVTDSHGDPVQGEFSLAVVDEAVLDLADPYAEDIDEAFYGERPLAVRHGLPMGLHAGREIILPGGIGGGGGGGAMVPPVRTQFPDTTYWQADIVTDERGQAQLTVTLPDNLTTWRVQVRGITAEAKVGQAVTEVITRKDILLRPVTPRFLVAGDHLGFAAIVHNNTDQELETEVSMQSTGLILDDQAQTTQVVEVPPQGRTRVEWWARVGDVDQAHIVFSASAGDLRDSVQPYQGDLPVLRYSAPRTFGTSGVLDAPGSRLEVVGLPRTYDPSSGSLEVELSPSLAAAVLSSLDVWEDEQQSTIGTVSHLLPNLAVYQVLGTLGQDEPLLKSRLDESIPPGLERLASLQNDDGGWGWWEGDESDRTITAYILFGLTRAERAGVFVDNDVYQAAQDYLLASLPSTEMLTRNWQYDRLVFQVYALSESGVDELPGVGNLYEYRTQLAPWSKALLGLVLEARDPADQRVETLFSNLENSVILSAAGAHWEEEDCQCRLNSTVTTTAMVTYALSQHDPQGQTLPDAVRYLLASRDQGGAWSSDYETAWSVLALSEIMKATGELEADFGYAASLNGTEIITGEARGPSALSAVGAETPVQTLRSDRPNALEIERSPGAGRLYYQSHLTLFRPAGDVKAFGRGMSLSRAYSYAEGGEDLTFTQHGSTAELITVHLTLSVERDTYYIKIKDIIPAGAEILDTRLKTTQQSQPAFHVSTPFREGWGWWYFNAPHVHDDHITWTSDFLPAGTYQLTYTLALNIPGEYQVLPAHAWQVYFPDIQATSAGDKFVITE